MNMKTTNRKAFTLIELLVAIGITILMLGAIQVIFRTSTDAVRLGIATSEVLNTSRTVSDQLESDTTTLSNGQGTMVGPGEGGYLVIINRRIGFAAATHPDTNLPVLPGVYVSEDNILNPTRMKQVGNTSNDKNIHYRRPVRSDQLIFIRRTGEIQPIVPSVPGQFAYDSSVTAEHARVWYGHILKTSPTGSFVYDENLDGNEDAGERTINSNGLGFPDGVSGSSEKIQPGTNQLASNWVLGRQILFLANNPSAASTIAQYSAAPAGMFRYLFAPITAYGPASMPPALFNATTPNLLRPTLADVADQTLADLTGEGGVFDGLTGTNYIHNAVGYAYGPWGQLWANTGELPPPPPASGGSTYSYADWADNYSYKRWQVAQTHPVLAPNVSDFIVEFAGDFQTPFDGKVDTTADGEIIWYSNFANDPVGPGGNNPNHPRVQVPPAAAFSGTGEAPATTSAYNVPNYATVQAFVFRHDDPDTAGNNTNWPHLIRVRYRIHDAKGRLSSGEERLELNSSGNWTAQHAEPGKWFTQIIEVNRN